ncbi:hypothetical protein [Emticicia sp. SJ17W-69]|uniref:hypothetical protein n=1 Tax=Emticicia sp. SJ17W-69 TaxID=3421657 RepID=UPI003EBA9151
MLRLKNHQNQRILRMKSFVLVWLLSFFSHRLIAQLKTNDSIFLQKAINHSVALYHLSLGDQSGLYNGSQYVGYSFTFKEGGQPYFYKDYTKGSIIYDQVLYYNIDLLYDEVADVLILKDGVRYIQLINNKISRFTIGSNAFVQLAKEPTNMIKSGFYHILYEGSINSVFKRETKTINEVLNSFEGIQRFIKTEQYYTIKNNNQYYLVNRKKDVLAIFKDHKKEIQQYIKSNKLNFKKERTNFLIKVCTYHDQLSN